MSAKSGEHESRLPGEEVVVSLKRVMLILRQTPWSRGTDRRLVKTVTFATTVADGNNRNSIEYS